MLLGEDFLVNVVREPHVEQAVLLLDEKRLLPGQFSALSLAVGLGVSGLRREYQPEPVPDALVLHLHLVEDRQHLGLDVRFLHPDAGMVAFRVSRAAVVDVFVDAAVLPLLLDQLAGDGMTAMAAGHELPGVGQRRRMVDVPAEQRLHPVPGRPVNQRLVLAGIPLSLVVDFADIGPILEDVVDRSAGEPWLRRAVHPAFGVDLLDHAVKRQVLVGVEMEHPLDVGRLLRVDFDETPAILADVAIAVGGRAAEPALPNPTGNAFADIHRHLFGVEARHVGEGSTHHATGGRVLGRLRDRDERQVVFGLQPFEFDVIEQIAGGPVHLVEEQRVEERSVLLGVGEQLAEGLALLALAGGFGDFEELDDLPAGLRRITLEGFLLHFQAEALAFLFPAADPCQGGELFHDDDPEERAWNKRPTVWIIVTASSGVRTAW